MRGALNPEGPGGWLPWIIGGFLETPIYDEVRAIRPLISNPNENDRQQRDEYVDPDESAIGC